MAFCNGCWERTVLWDGLKCAQCQKDRDELYKDRQRAAREQARRIADSGPSQEHDPTQEAR